MNYLKSVVVVEINKVLSDTIQGQGSQLITGCSACLRRDADSEYSPDRIYWYNPRAAAMGYVPAAEVNPTGAQPEVIYSDRPITIMRLFSVYGPWNRPDMALFKFTESILKGKLIDVYNHGNMQRDFIYIEDLIEAIYILTSCMPSIQRDGLVNSFDSISPVAPFRIVNIGNSKAIKICDYIKEIEKSLKMNAKKNLIPIQDGDVENTCADIKLLENLTGYRPSTPISVGISKFIRWYKNYYK